jgi:N utilization substance protein B
VVKDYADLDSKIKPYLGRLPEELDPVENAILRIATYELAARIDVPYKVVINEAIELAKSFGADESHKFVNGVLDKAIKTLRKDELATPEIKKPTAKKVSVTHKPSTTSKKTAPKK